MLFNETPLKLPPKLCAGCISGSSKASYAMIVSDAQINVNVQTWQSVIFFVR